MKYIKQFTCIVIVLGLMSSCKKEQLSTAKEILGFSIEASLNKNILETDVVGVISGNGITLSFPYNTNVSSLIATFTFNGKSITVEDEVQISKVTANDFSKKLNYIVTASDDSRINYSITVIIKEPEWQPGVPHFYINTEGGAPIISKEDYLNATIKIDGMGAYEGFEGNTRIKGRGNSTWFGFPKKPYRLKLDDAAGLLGLSPEKDWILLANYLDGTLMLNSIAMKIGHLLEMPYTNTMIPVDVTLNGTYIGSYTFTEQKEVEENRINVVDGGVLLELDTYYDEDYKFKSAYYGLPVMIQYPELEDYPKSDADIEMAKIKTDFQVLEDAIASTSFPDNNYLDLLDAESLVNFLIVYNLCQNEEINHPKSTYIHKHKDGKYMMGPIWDFDWAFDYEGNNKYFTHYNKPLFWTGDKLGTQFFSRFLTDPAIKILYKQKWQSFKQNKMPLLLEYLDDYVPLIEESQKKDYEVWKRGSGDFKADAQKLRTWLQNRAMYIDNYVAGF